MMNDDEIAGIIKNELDNALGENDSDEWRQSRSDALDFYFGKKPHGTSGRSRVVSTDVADMIENTLSQVLPAFQEESICEFIAESEDDENQAQEESDCVNYIYSTQNDGYIQLYTALKDGLLHRNSIIKVYYREDEQTEYRHYNQINDIEMQQIMQPQPGIDRVEVVAVDVLSQPIIDEITQELIQPGVYNITLAQTKVTSRPYFEAVPAEEFRINSDHESIDITRARFVAHERPVRANDLLRLGIDWETIEDLPTFVGYDDITEMSRDRDDSEQWHDSPHRSTRPILLSECYLLLDVEDTGQAARYKVLYSNGKILSKELFSHVPFSCGSPYLMPHRFVGVSLFDKEKEIQNTKTSLIRQTLDNAYIVNNGRYEVRHRGFADLCGV